MARAKDKKSRSKINKLVEWAQSKNWTVHFSSTANDKMSPWDREIEINTRYSEEIQLYGLLHECGHVIIQKNKNYSKKYTYASKVDKMPSKNSQLLSSKKYQVDLIAEEIEAWRKGKELAKRLNLKINEEKYNNEMFKYVYSYIQAASE